MLKYSERTICQWKTCINSFNCVWTLLCFACFYSGKHCNKWEHWHKKFKCQAWYAYEPLSNNHLQCWNYNSVFIKPTAYLGPCLTSLTELFCKNTQQLLAMNCFWKKICIIDSVFHKVYWHWYFELNRLVETPSALHFILYLQQEYPAKVVPWGIYHKEAAAGFFISWSNSITIVFSETPHLSWK